MRRQKGALAHSLRTFKKEGAGVTTWSDGRACIGIADGDFLGEAKDAQSPVPAQSAYEAGEIGSPEEQRRKRNTMDTTSRGEVRERRESKAVAGDRRERRRCESAPDAFD